MTSTEIVTGFPALAASAATVGTEMMIWPIANHDIHLDYSYRVQHADLVAAAAT